MEELERTYLAKELPKDLTAFPSKEMLDIYLPSAAAHPDLRIRRRGLEGLVLVDVEFSSIEKKDAFAMPAFCLAEVTQEKFLAGGMLCGKTYADIAATLHRFGYQKLFLP